MNNSRKEFKEFLGGLARTIGRVKRSVSDGKYTWGEGLVDIAASLPDLSKGIRGLDKVQISELTPEMIREDQAAAIAEYERVSGHDATPDVEAMVKGYSEGILATVRVLT